MNATGVGSKGIRRGAWLAAAALLADVGFLRNLWIHFGYWGIWDWDFQCALLEAARQTIVGYGELPLWDPWLGGGSSLVGNPLASTYAPSFLPVLALGTIHGVKIVLLLYLWIAQIGAYRLARSLGLGVLAAVLAALVFSWGGVFAQHFTNGHIGWIGYAWLPFSIGAFRRATAPGALGWRRAGPLAAAGVYLALAFLDGGPYHYVLVPAFLASYAAVLALEGRSLRPLVALPIVGALGVGLAAVEIFPTVEMTLAYPRPTEARTDYYGAPFEPTVGRILYQAFLSPAQAHDARRWQPFFLNVGAYVGILPLLLALAALGLRARRAWPWALLTVGWLVVCLGGALPAAVDPWPLLHRLPGLDSLKIPMRFRILPLLTLAVWAAHGLQALGEIPWLRRARRVALPLVVAVIGVDLALVNGAVFRSAFVVPPIPVEPERTLRYEPHRLYRNTYRRTAVEPIFPNWPTGALPAVLANQGLIFEFWPREWPHATVASSSPAYPGVEAFPVAGSSRIVSFVRTPNHVSLRVVGGGGVLAVNQNYQPGWKASLGQALPWQGLLAVRAPKGAHEIRLDFRPTAFLAGAAVSLASSVGVVGLALRSRRG